MPENFTAGRPLYIFGCDMGGWHNKDKSGGDALAVCKYLDAELSHVEATAALSYYPRPEDDALEELLASAMSELAQIVVCIDAAFSWPEAFRELVADAPNNQHSCNFILNKAINNPYLYRATDRFIKERVLLKKDPLSAVGDRFGNNSSKAQVLVRWLMKRMPNAYNPPFDDWDQVRARAAQHTIIEVYPAASMKSAAFKKLTWPPHTQDMNQIGSNDIADAKRCAMTGLCYAAHVGIIQPQTSLPELWTPHDVADSNVDCGILKTEGWIFSPKLRSGEQT